jgi:hypothetical protein
MPALQLTKITKKQLNLLGSLLVYFHEERRKALERLQWWTEEDLREVRFIHNIPLTKLYHALKVSAANRAVAKFAAAVFFRRVTTGSQFTGYCSGWQPLEQPHINEQMKKLIPQLFQQNLAHITGIEAIMQAPQELDENKKPIYVSVTTSFAFDDKKQATVFHDLVTAIEIEEELTRETTNQKGYTLQHSLDTVLAKWTNGDWPVNARRAFNMLARSYHRTANEIRHFIDQDEYYKEAFEAFAERELAESKVVATEGGVLVAAR